MRFGWDPATPDAAWVIPEPYFGDDVLPTQTPIGPRAETPTVIERRLRVVDVTLEPDDRWLQDVEDAVRNAAQNYDQVQEIRLRREQWEWLKASVPAVTQTAASAQPEIQAIFGVPFIVVDDGLTLRERSIKRAERSLGPTRQQQVAAYLEAERLAHAAVAKQLREAHEAARELGERADDARFSFTKFLEAHEYGLIRDGTA